MNKEMLLIGLADALGNMLFCDVNSSNQTKPL